MAKDQSSGANDSKYFIYNNIQENIGFEYSFQLFFPLKFCKTYQDMFNKEFIFTIGFPIGYNLLWVG
jgi:hypothetical protein